MPRPRSKQTQDALDDIKAGMSQADAGRKHGVDQGQISRMLKPKERTVNVKLNIGEVLGVIQVGAWSSEFCDKLEVALLKLQDKK